MIQYLIRGVGIACVKYISMFFLIFQIAYLIVDEMHEDHPELIKDQYWDDVEFELPYTAAAAEYRVPEPHLGSAMDIE